MTPAFERKAAGIYRSIFVDLRKVAARMAVILPDGANVLDIGGGDGELLNLLLADRPDIRVTMVDVAESVGKFVEDRHRQRVQFLPKTTIQDHLAAVGAHYDAAIVSDVVHHIPPSMRTGFIACVQSSLKPHGMLLVKDVEPGHAIAWLSLFCDHYVSGDRGVELISVSALRELAANCLPPHVSSEVGLLQQAKPNYLVRFDFQPAGR
jgi:2-polyprenyl-3-methyl-5-hydroxy-6-metoxy-1,4-benzoquinol methylase